MSANHTQEPWLAAEFEGCDGYAYDPAEMSREAAIVAVVRRAGAMPFALWPVTDREAEEMIGPRKQAAARRALAAITPRA